MISGKTSIIVINYNTRELTDNLIKSIHEHGRGEDYNVILIDNGSHDGSVEFFRDRHDKIQLIRNHTNTGFAHAANQGAQHADGEYLLFLNSDCELKEPILGRFKEVFAAHDDAGALTPRIVDQNGRFHSVCRNFPNYINILFSRGSFLYRLGLIRDESHEYTLGDSDQVTRVDALAGTCMFTSRQLFDRMGGFDQRYFLYFEDTDICRRMSLEDRNCYYVPDIEVMHIMQASSSNSVPRRLYHHHKSAMEYFLKWYPSKVIHNLGLFFLLTVNLLFQIILHYAGLRQHNRS